VKVRGCFQIIYEWKEEQQMRLIEKILSEENLNEAVKKVKANKGASGIDKMTTSEIDEYLSKHKDEIINQIMNKSYTPSL